MAAYVLVEIEITNMDGMAPYMEAVGDTVSAHGGKYLIRAGETEVVEGGLGEYPLKVVLEFPSMEAAKGWYNSSEYQALIPIRTANSTCNFILAEGV